ncbi:MAG TPA: DUF11 domain-containing protein [Micromonosporaceae bacterium]
MPRLRRTAVLSALLLGLVPGFVLPAGAAQAAGPVDLFIDTVDDRPDPVDAYATVSYVVTVGNRGPGTATAVTVTAQLPSGVSFQPSTVDDRCSATLTTVTCDLSTLPASAMTSPLIVDLTPTTAGPMSLTFTVSAAERDTNPADNSQTETTSVVMPTEADVALYLGQVFGPVYAAEPFWFGAGVQNLGPAPATGATAVLRLPAGLSVVSGASCVPDAAGSVCTVGPMDLPPPGGSIAPLYMLASAPGTYTISGSASADQPDPQPANNTGSVTFTVAPAADVAVAIADSADPTHPGQALTDTVTVTNNGPSPASDVRLTDDWSTTVAGGLAVLSIDASQGQCTLTAPASVDCGLGDLASGAAATVTLRFRPRGVGSVTNQAQVTATEYDGNTANNLATETTSVR